MHDHTKTADWCIVVTCEHGGKQVPDDYASLFAGCETLLASHRGYDPGALAMGARLAQSVQGEYFNTTVTRLLVDLNRSEHHPRLHGHPIAGLPVCDRERIKQLYYRPYRQQVEHYIATQLSQGVRIVHVSSHSFTPVLDGAQRSADIGLLYDPQRPMELSLAKRWQHCLHEQLPGLRIRRNYPYRGTADGFTTHLRKRFDPARYVGLELEINQCWPQGTAYDWERLQQCVCSSFARAFELEDTS